MAAEKEHASADATASDLYESRRDFGLRLRELRIRQGLSPTDVAEKTRVNSDFIAAIEAGEFERLPGRLFARGFVAAILKLCSGDESLLTEFDSLWTDDGIRPAISDSTKMRLAGRKGGIGRSRSSLQPLRRAVVSSILLGVAVIVCAALWIGYSKAKPYAARLLAKYGKSTAAVDEGADTDKPAKNVAANAATPQSAGSPAPATDQPVATEVVSSDGTQSLTITVLEPVKIKFETDNEKPVIKDFGVGVYKFGFRKSTDLLIYDAAAVRISFNGNPIGPLGAKGRVRRIGFRADAPGKSSF